jgi:hypothetical protein
LDVFGLFSIDKCTFEHEAVLTSLFSPLAILGDIGESQTLIFYRLFLWLNTFLEVVAGVEHMLELDCLRIDFSKFLFIEYSQFDHITKQKP